MSTEVATQDAGLPDLVRPAQAAANTLDANDVTLPRLYRGESQSNAFKDGNVELGSIYIAQGSEDPEPITVATTKKGEESSSTIRAHFLAVKKGLSVRENNELRTWQWGDPSAPAEARTTYDFTLVLPEIDEDIPVKVLMSSTSTQTAKRINFLLLKLDDPTRWPELAFELSIKRREKTDGGSKQVWYVWQAKTVEADENHVAIARKVADMMGISGDTTPPAPAPKPEI